MVNKRHYPWWGYIKDIIQDYPDGIGVDLRGVAKREFDAVQAAVDATEGMNGGENRMKVIRLVYFEGTHTIDGAALVIPCGRRTAMRWQRRFFEEVARNRDLLD